MVTQMTPHYVRGHWAPIVSELVMWLPKLPKLKKWTTNRHTDPLLYISKIYILFLFLAGLFHYYHLFYYFSSLLLEFWNRRWAAAWESPSAA